MKKLLLVLAIGAFAACNSGSTTETGDSTMNAIDSSKSETKDAIDSSASAMKDSVDAAAKMSKDSVKAVDSTKK